DTLSSLVDKSILRHDADRFWMLETIREFGGELLDDSRRADVIESHGVFFERFAAGADTALRGPEGAGWLDRVENELPNVRAAMGHALERGLAGRTLGMATCLGRYWEARSGSTEGRRWLEQALAAGTVDDATRAGGCFW